MSKKRELTRSEQVRQRRAERLVKEREQTAKRAVKPIVPVTSRTPTIPIKSKPKLVAKPRRQFNIALGLPDIHLHKPKISMPRFHFHANWRIVSFILSALFGTMLYLALTHPYFYVPAATVLGNNRLSRDEINTVLGVTNKSIFTIQPDDIATRLLLNYPELASADVKVYLPNHVFVTVTERQPVILWQQDSGYTWVDETGVAFRPRGTADGLVIVSAVDIPPAGSPSDTFAPTPFMQAELVDSIITLAPSVPTGSTLVYDSAKGLGWVDPRGWEVAFGTGAVNMPLKLSVYNSLVDSLTSRNLKPEFINVVYPDAPFYRMAEVPFEEFSVEDTEETGQ